MCTNFPKMHKKYILIILLLTLVTSLIVNAGDKSASVGINGGLKLKTVVIDAGHGGHDPGALGKHIQEKEITLAIALKLGELIKMNLPEVKVIYTRSTDVFVELKQRAEIANKNNADLFISIHVNSNPNPNASGVDTWVMGQYKNNENFQVAKSENRAILAETNYSSQYEGFDPNSTESYIIFNLMQNAFIGQSLEFATGVQKEVNFDGRKDRGVESAPFLVLWKTKMPSVLVETGFISNSEDEKLLKTQSGQIQMASAIFRAFRDYKTKVDNRTTVSVFEQPTETSSEKTIAKNDTKDQSKTDGKSIVTNDQQKSEEKKQSKTTVASATKPLHATKSVDKPNQKNEIKDLPKSEASTNNITQTQKSTNIQQKNSTVTNTFPKVVAQDQTASKNNNISQQKNTAKDLPKSEASTNNITQTQKSTNIQQKNSTVTNTFPKVVAQDQTASKNNNISQQKNTAKDLPKSEASTNNITQTQKSTNIQQKNSTVTNTFPKVATQDQTASKNNNISQQKNTAKDLPKFEASANSVTQTQKSTENQQKNSTIANTFPKINSEKQQAPPPINTVKTNYLNQKDTAIYFSVQILSSVKKIRLDSSIFKGVKKIREIKLSGAYKYLVGSELEYNNVVLLKNKTRELFPDAFVVALKNGIKVPITEALDAKKLTKK